MSVSRKIPLPKELAEDQRTKDLLQNETFSKGLEKLTQKEANLAVATIVHAGKSKTELMRIAGYKDVHNGTKRFQKIEGKLGKALLREGITEADLICIMKEGLTARKTKVFTNKIKNKNDDGYHFEHEVIDIGPDYKSKKEMFKIIVDLGGYMPSGKLEIKHKHEHNMNSFIDNAIEREKEILDNQVDANFEVVDESVN